MAGFAGVTVRTLHHYDAIGLLVPSARSHAGHRRYSDADLDRLQQILFYRELGFPLEEVAALLDDPAADPRAHLRRQHDLLTARIERLQKMAAAVEQAMEARTMGINLTPEEKFEVFGDFDPDQYQEEVQERWGDTDAYRQSQQKTASYTKEDWQRIQRESDELTRRFVALMDAGEPADSEAAMDVAEDHRQGITRNHYDCGYEMHTCLGEMYVNDERSRATSTRRRRVWPRTCGTRSSPTPYGTPPEWSWPGRSGPRPAVIPHGAGSRLSPGRGTVHPGYPRGTWASTAAFIIWAASPALDPQLQEPHPRDHPCARPRVAEPGLPHRDLQPPRHPADRLRGIRTLRVPARRLPAVHGGPFRGRGQLHQPAPVAGVHADRARRRDRRQVGSAT